MIMVKTQKKVAVESLILKYCCVFKDYHRGLREIRGTVWSVKLEENNTAEWSWVEDWR